MAPTGRRGRGPTLAAVRRTATAILVLLAAVLPAVAVASWWAYGQATDTSRFMKTAAPLATDAQVQRRVIDELVAAARVPGGDAAIRARIQAVAARLDASPAYRQSWLAIQRTVHARLAARLNGGSDAPLTLDLGPVAAVLRSEVAAAGLPQVAATLRDPAPVTIADRRAIRRARRAADALRIIRAVSIPGAVLALIGALLTARRPSSGLLRLGGCLAISALLLIGGRLVVQDAIAGHGTAGAVAVAVLNVLTRPLTPWVIGGLAAAVGLGALGAALAAAARRPA
jgi:hypothetical protein